MFAPAAQIVGGLEQSLQEYPLRMVSFDINVDNMLKAIAPAPH
ncbi:hypothetical protein [Salipiger mangrovisoli]|nr:hypothetical protein [Salipiger mangrovisoli]